MAVVRPSTAFNSYVNNQRNKNKASKDSTFVLKSADFQQARLSQSKSLMIAGLLLEFLYGTELYVF